jgi:ubiquinone/menaquinone biosynthesis C-methylase UbiE
MLARYNPKFFEADSIDHAKKIILFDDTIPDQWETETKWTMNFFREKNLFNEKSIVLDWGCGIGRLAKPIIEEFNCKVVGVDFQSSMLKYATEYVNHSNFTAINNEEFYKLPDDYFTVGIAVWAFQHCTNIEPIIKNAQRTLKNNSKLCIFDANIKAIPVEIIDDEYYATKDDIIIKVPAAEEENIFRSWQSNEPIWAHADNNCAEEIKEYFSTKELGKFSLPLQEESNVTLSEYINKSWWGIFINNRKYYYI